MFTIYPKDFENIDPFWLHATGKYPKKRNVAESNHNFFLFNCSIFFSVLNYSPGLILLSGYVCSVIVCNIQSYVQIEEKAISVKNNYKKE